MKCNIWYLAITTDDLSNKVDAHICKKTQTIIDDYHSAFQQI